MSGKLGCLPFQIQDDTDYVVDLPSDGPKVVVRVCDLCFEVGLLVCVPDGKTFIS